MGWWASWRNPTCWPRWGTGKDEATCRAGFLYGNFLKRFCTVGWAVVGLMVAVLVTQGSFGTTSLADPEDAFGFACRHLLFSGALGLLIASIMAANMSTCSAFMVDSGALFTQGFYRRHVFGRKSDPHYLWVGRVSGLLIALVGVIYAIFLIDKVLYSFLLTETMATYMGISILAGIVWPRANRWGALASLVTSITTNFALYYQRGERLDHWDPNVFFASLVAGFASLVVVSWFTSPEPRTELTSFRARLQTPSDSPADSVSISSETVPGKSEVRAEAAEPSRTTAEQGRQLLLVNLLNLRRAACGVGFWKAYRIDLGGLGIGWVLAVALVAVVWALFRM